MSLTSPTADEIEFHYQRTLMGTDEEKSQSLGWLTAANLQMLMAHQFLIQQMADARKAEAARAASAPDFQSVLHSGL